ncbi:hypothetical protein SAMN05421678_11217 [Actinopolymorpha cephalotaxi]|uniref:Uncharacterized protein n=1 Tax=Actinopolymorpha cephalotaxi TaxID=504797 RepID=A0A1I2X7Q3_9ACTN|nr:hypothetical protein [Actinopolymorpha cephalotaxi]NYH86080.1 hypothetical protein [Actinopolymorpha cephalotaxi]SFH08979.1 hypothetical protein SAMN05421678_11217 [Actinopolymorpha cephalotaxi]
MTTIEDTSVGARVRTLTAAALLLALAIPLAALFLNHADRYVTFDGNQGCPRTVLDEMFNLNEGAYHQGEPRSDAQIKADKKACLRAALPSMTVATTSMTGAGLVFIAGLSLLTRSGRRARRLVLTATGIGIGIVALTIVVTAAHP